jgi:hypothetical protein
MDTGADRTLLPLHWAEQLGIDVPNLKDVVTLKSATGHPISGKTVVLPAEVVRNSTCVCWLAELVVTDDSIRYPHWGMRGFQEYFEVNYSGPKRYFTLTPGPNLPVTNPPTT